jgi:O-antigen/teichoic acid export membrane protein
LQRVFQHSALYAFGNIAGRVVAFLAIPFYSRFLSPAQYGLIELIELSTQTIAIAFGLQAVGTALTRLYHDQASPEAERSVASTALIGTAMLSACVTVASVAASGAISRAVFHTDAWATLLQAAFVAMFFASTIEVVLVYERMRGHARFYLAYSLVTLGLNLGLNILFIGGLDAGVWGFVSSKLITSVSGAGFLAWRLRRDVGWHWHGAYVPEFVRFGAPLILSGLSYFAIHFSDRFFLTSAVSLAELGRYALAYRFALMVNALVGDSFAKSWTVSLYRHTGDAGWREQFARVAAYFTFAVALAGFAIAVFGPELLRVMVPDSFFPPALLLPILVLAYVVRDIADFFRSLLLINKRSVWVGKIALAAAVLNLLANMVLIPAYGTYGAAWATLLTWSAYLVVCWVAADREHRLPVRVASYARLLGLMVAAYAAAATIRADGFALQAVLDGAWVALFAAAAAAVFFSASERQAILRQLASFMAGTLVRAVPGAPDLRTGDRHVLMLAYYFPPQNAIGAARPYRFVRYLRRLGTSVSVVCSPLPEPGSRYEERPSAPAPHGGRDGEQGGPGGDEPPAIRVPGVAPAHDHRRLEAISRLLQAVQRVLLPYDDRLAWLPYACAAASSEVKPGTVLVSTYPPVVTHLAALALKRRTGQPWIADFRDPLWGNPSRTAFRAGLIDRATEWLVVHQADAVIANTDASAAMLARRYPALAGKISTIWNGFDPEDRMEPLPRADRARRVISHIGSLYGARTPLPFIACLNRLVAGGAIPPGAIEFRQVGYSDPECLDPTEPAYQALQAHGCLQVVTHIIPQREARREMLTADWLLLLDMNESNPGLQIPAKTFEYIRACRPILALTTPGSSTERVLALSGIPHACIDFSAAPERFDAAVLAFLRHPFPDAAPSKQFWSEFDACRQTAALSALIDRVRSRPVAQPVKAGFQEVAGERPA